MQYRVQNIQKTAENFRNGQPYNPPGMVGVDADIAKNWHQFVRLQKAYADDGSSIMVIDRNSSRSEEWEAMHYLKKADTDLAALTAGNGVLEPQFFDRFIQLLQLEPTVLQQANVMDMQSFEKKLSKVTYGERAMFPSGEKGALPEGARTAADFSGVTLRVVKFRGAFPFTFDGIRDAINQDTFLDQMMSEIGKRIGADMEENLNSGDTTSVTPYLQPFDGLVASATSNTVAAGGTELRDEDLTALQNELPNQFSRNSQSMRFILELKQNRQLRDYLSKRGTALGDQNVTADKGESIAVSGSRTLPADIWPSNLGGGTETAVIYTSMDNVAVGVWKVVEITRHVDVPAEVVTIFVTVRWVFEYVHEPAVSKLTGLTAL